jgi:hypothetical protein
VSCFIGGSGRENLMFYFPAKKAQDVRRAVTTSQRSSAAFLAGKKTSSFIFGQHHTRKNSSVS